LAAHLSQQGVEISSDPDSVDLFGEHSGIATIYEVKSVEGPDWRDRVRLAVGQVLEYQSRFERDKGLFPIPVVVLSREVEVPGYLKLHLRRLGIGLLARCDRGFKDLLA